MTRAELERSIENYLCTKMCGAFPKMQMRKFECRRGDPDRLFLLPNGNVVFVEVKRPGESLRPEQERAAKRLRDLGYTATWVSTRDEVDNLIVDLVLQVLNGVG